jgi:hypothetical protein
MTADEPAWTALYREAFRRYGGIALWFLRELPAPTPANALNAARALRDHGDLPARRLAERIEEACRAADAAATPNS